MPAPAPEIYLARVKHLGAADKRGAGAALEFAAVKGGVAGARMQFFGVDHKGLAFVQQYLP